MDEDGFAVTYVCKWLPYWALELAKLYRERGELYFSFRLEPGVLVEIFWPDEKTCENFYL